MGKELKASPNIYAGLFFLTLATLSYEMLLTRIFSVTMWYHFAFLSISIVMFGMTAGAILVYLLPHYFKPELTIYHLSQSTLWFALSIVISFLLYLPIPFLHEISLRSLILLGFTYLIIAIPFIFSGISVCLALTRFPSQVSKLYFIDLLGAGMGCFLLIYLLKITDGPTAVIFVAFLAGLASLLFILPAKDPRMIRAILSLLFFLGAYCGINSYLVHKQKPLLRLVWIKGGFGGVGWETPVYEKWSSFAYLHIKERASLKPFGWGLSELCPRAQKVKQLILTIDGCASTPITQFDGDISKLEYLKYDVTNLAHYLRDNAKVLVIGAGGGRDVLSALAFKQKSVLAVEMNPDILYALNDRFGDFSGHLDQIPGVKFVADEGRSYVASSSEKFDIIQVSLVDTWAATASGAFILTEHSLYTVEAWKDFLKHLNPKGILSFSYWYTPEQFPVAIYRMISLANTALKELGKPDPRAHILIVRHLYKLRLPPFPAGVATVLVSNEPFSQQDIEQIENIAQEMKFELVLKSGFALTPAFEAVASEKGLEQFPEFYFLNLKPTRDNSPFFFYALKFKNVFSPKAWKEIEKIAGIGPPFTIFILGALLFLSVTLTFIFIIGPLLITADKKVLKGSFPFFSFFLAIGFGFMLIEISQMQRLMVFLGHPTYGLSVVLFSLLFSSGLGSLLTSPIKEGNIKRLGIVLLILLLLILGIYGGLTPLLLHRFQPAPTTIRISLALAILFPLGLLMGTAFPLGIKISSRKSPALLPWLWGINGSASVCASVIAVTIALNSTISATFWTGAGFYLLALLSFIQSSKT